MKDKPVILIVDDDPDIVETLDFALRRRGYSVRVAYDGQEALASAKTSPPDLMLLDVMLPGCNGYEVSRRLKDWMRQRGDVSRFPIMLLTARRLNSADREEFVATWSRADSVMYKPFALDRLVESIHDLTPAVAVAGRAAGAP
jgi:DNA-binding response OmpR family regulator